MDGGILQGYDVARGRPQVGERALVLPTSRLTVVSDLSANLDRIDSIWGHRRLTTYQPISLLTWENLTETAMASRAGSA